MNTNTETTRQMNARHRREDAIEAAYRALQAEVDATWKTDPDLANAVCSAGENASDLHEYESPEWFAEAVRQVEGWKANGREW